MSKIKTISITETARLIRTSLREAFPGIKFGVRARRDAFAASIYVIWCDGPSTLQVEAITRRFAAAYHDQKSDAWLPLWHRLRGECVSFGAHHVFCQRQHSDAWCAEAIQQVYDQHRALLEARGVPAPTVRDFFDGRLHAVTLAPLGVTLPADQDDLPFGDRAAPDYPSLLDEVRRALDERSDCAAPANSTTAMSVTVLGVDNPAASLAEAGWVRAIH